MKLTYLYRDTDLGMVDLPHASFPTCNLVYFCQDCGKNWGIVKREGSHTWRIVYRVCGCNPHDALTLFESSCFSLSPYQIKPGLPEWSCEYSRWPTSLLHHELTTLLRNIENGKYFDCPSRTPWAEGST